MQRFAPLFLNLALLIGYGCGTTRNTAPTTVTDPPAPAAESPAEVAAEDFRATAPEPGPAPEIRLGDFEEFTLDNGLTVVLVENHKLPRVSYQLYVDVPPHLEGEYAGAQSLLGNMLRRATSTKSKEEIDDAVDFIGAGLSTSGSGAYASTISKYKEEVLDLMSEVVLDAAFPETEFTKVKDEAKAALAQEITTPDAIANRVRQAVTYGTMHPYGELMTEASLEAISLEVVKSVYDTYFVPNRSYLVMVGDLQDEEARRLATQYFGDWEEKEVAVPTYPTPQRPTGVTVNFVPRPGSVQSNVILTHAIELQPGTKESIRAGLLDQALGTGFNSRLLSNLREDKAYTYGAYSSISPDRVIGNFRAYANVRNEVTDSAITEFIYELQRLKDDPVSEGELSVAKARTMGSFGRALESPQRIASFALNTVRYDLDRDFYPEYLQVVQNTSLNDLAEVTDDLIDAGRTNIIVVGDPSVAEKIARFASDGQVRYLDVNGQPVDRADSAAPADVSVTDVLNGYFEAIGGKDAALAVKNLKLVLEGNVQGQTITQTMITTNDGRMSSQTNMAGMAVADQRVNGGKVSMKQMGQPQELPEAAANAMAEKAVVFSELRYLDIADQISIEGTESVDGKQAIVLLVPSVMGPVREYYDAESMIKLQSVMTQGPQTITQSFLDYREVDGILIPHTIKMTGMLPFPLELKATTVEVNADLDPELFTVE